jgi:hypothetical protein
MQYQLLPPLQLLLLLLLLLPCLTNSSNMTGDCKYVVASTRQNSRWCKLPSLTTKPSKSYLKIGRQTIYVGPVLKQLGYCGEILTGTRDAVGVALSTKYMTKGFKKDPYCGRYICVKILSNDRTSNPTPPATFNKYRNTIFKGRIIDICPECDDDHIDVLADQPLTTSPVGLGNPYAAVANARGPTRIIPLNILFAVGVWEIEWGFALKNTKCHGYF